MSTLLLATLVDQGKLASLANEVEADGGTRPILLEQDFMTPDAPRKIADAAPAALGHVDIPVNNAGGSRPMVIDAPEDQWVGGITLVENALMFLASP